MNRIRLLIVVVLLGLLAPTATAQSPEKPREGLKELALELGGRAKKAIGDRKIRVGYFTPSGIDHSNSGQALAAELAIVLGDVLNTNDSKGLELKGDYYFVEDPNNSQLKVIKIEAVIKDLDRGGNFKEFSTFEGFIRHNADIARFMGAHVSFKPDSEYKEDPAIGRNKDIQKSLPPATGKPPANPPALERGTQVKVGKYSIEILAAKNINGPFKPLPFILDDKSHPGLPVVEMDKDTFYQVRIINHDTVESAVFLHLDGIDQFAFSEDRLANGRPMFGSWIVEAGKDTVIKGWHKNVNPGAVFSFLTTEVGKGAASKFPTLSQGKTGTICVSIAHTKPEGTKGPGLETTLGPPVVVKQEAVRRVVGDPHEFVTIRYSR